MKGRQAEVKTDRQRFYWDGVEIPAGLSQMKEHRGALLH